MKIYLVGGAVRNELLGINIEDRDWLVVGSNREEMVKLGFIQVGKNFPVFLHPRTKEEYALARKEVKVSKGHHGFELYCTKKISLREDLKRRDLTINAMVIDKITGKIYDPFLGRKDLALKKLRHVSDSFREDPLRIVRLARFNAKFFYLGFSISSKTIILSKSIINTDELLSLSGERIYKELMKALSTNSPWVFFETLHMLKVFKKILKPMEKIISRKEIFSPLKTAISEKVTNSYILFSLVFFNMTEKDISSISDYMKIPNLLRKLVLDLNKFNSILNFPHNFSPQVLLQSLIQVNFFRNQYYMEVLLKSCYLIKKDKNVLQNHEKIIGAVKKIIGFQFNKRTRGIKREEIANLVWNIKLDLVKKIIY